MRDGLDFRTDIRDENKMGIFFVHVHGVKTTGLRHEVDWRLVTLLDVTSDIRVSGALRDDLVTVGHMHE